LERNAPKPVGATVVQPANALWPKQFSKLPVHAGPVPASLHYPAVDMENTGIIDKAAAIDAEDACWLATYSVAVGMGAFAAGALTVSTDGVGGALAGGMMTEAALKGGLLADAVCGYFADPVVAEKTTGPVESSPIDPGGEDQSPIDESGDPSEPGPGGIEDPAEPTGTEGTADPADESIPGKTGTGDDPSGIGDDDNNSDDDGSPKPDPVGKPDPNDPTGFQASASLAAYTKNGPTAPAFLTGKQFSVR